MCQLSTQNGQSKESVPLNLTVSYDFADTGTTIINPSITLIQLTSIPEEWQEIMSVT